MPIDSRMRRFNLETISETPDYQGAYELYEGNQCVYIGATERGHGARWWLKYHFSGGMIGSAAKIDGFKLLPSAYPLTERQRLLRRYKFDNGQLPRFNKGN